MEEKEKEIIDETLEETPEDVAEIDETGGGAEEGTEEKSERLYTFAKVLGEELDEETYQAILPKLEEYHAMGFDQEQVEYLVIEDLLEDLEEEAENGEESKKAEINSKLSKEEKLAWKQTGTLVLRKVGENLADTVKQMMFNPEMFRVLYALTKSGSTKQTGKTVTDAEKLVPKKTDDELYDDYISEIRNVLGNRKKVLEIKNKWLKDHPELKGKIRI